MKLSAPGEQLCCMALGNIMSYHPTVQKGLACTALFNCILCKYCVSDKEYTSPNVGKISAINCKDVEESSCRRIWDNMTEIAWTDLCLFRDSNRVFLNRGQNRYLLGRLQCSQACWKWQRLLRSTQIWLQCQNVKHAVPGATTTHMLSSVTYEHMPRGADSVSS